MSAAEAPVRVRAERDVRVAMMAMVLMAFLIGTVAVIASDEIRHGRVDAWWAWALTFGAGLFNISGNARTIARSTHP